MKMLYRIRLRVLMFIVSTFYQVSENRKPILLPNSRQIIINEGEALNITCISDGPIRFIFPNNGWVLSLANFFDLSKDFYRYNHYTENTFFYDTGWYHCIEYFPSINPYSAKYSYNSYNSEESWVYVYVKSNKNFFVDRNTNTHLDAIAGGNVVIPCRTTSPDLKPILINGNKDEVSKTSFDPRRGFTIRNLVLEDSNSYKCLIEMDNKVHAVNYELSVHLTRKLTGPELQISNLNGRNFHVNCTIEIEVGMQYEIDWNTPQQNSSRRQIKIFEKEINGNTLLVTSQLMLFNYKDEDLGDYECVVKSGQDIKKEKTSVIEFRHESETRFKFFSKDNYYKKKESGENVLLKIKVYNLENIYLLARETLQW